MRIEQHELWVSSSGAEGTQLVAEDMMFVELDLSAVILTSAEIPGARFVRCNLENADFFGANLASAEFSDCRLAGANLAKANLDYVVFRGVVFDNTSLFRSSLYKANFINTSVKGVNMERAYTEGMTLQPSAVEPNYR